MPSYGGLCLNALWFKHALCYCEYLDWLKPASKLRPSPQVGYLFITHINWNHSSCATFALRACNCSQSILPANTYLELYSTASNVPLPQGLISYCHRPKFGLSFASNGMTRKLEFTNHKSSHRLVSSRRARADSFIQNIWEYWKKRDFGSIHAVCFCSTSLAPY